MNFRALAFLLAGLNVGIVSGLVFSGETEYTWSHVAMINLGTAASTVSTAVPV